MSLDHPAVLVGIFTVVLLAFSTLNSIWADWLERRAQRQARTVDLYNEYYSADNYRRIVFPVFCIHLKWHALPEEQKAGYRAAVRRGWLGFETEPERLLDAYIGTENPQDDPDKSHFRDTQSARAFTEHESLTVFLYFWTKVHEMLQAGVIEPDMTRRLLKRPYSYVAGFLKDLGDDMETCAEVPDLPAWVKATRNLDKILT